MDSARTAFVAALHSTVLVSVLLIGLISVVAAVLAPRRPPSGDTPCPDGTSS
jgi:hypothetical protein